MPFLDRVLEVPSYGWKCPAGNLIKPSPGKILKEFFSRMDIRKSRKNWMPFFSWLKVLALTPFFFVFLFHYLSWYTFTAAFVYSMIIMGTHGTIWHHRYCTHGAYRFRNRFWRFITQNLTICMVSEELYVVSHHVHHAKSDEPGDPYNAQGGFLYCFLADVIHQPIAKDLSAADYEKVVRMLRHSGVKANSYIQYQRWGSYTHPARAVISCLLNWSFWYTVFFLIGGNTLACTLFGAAAFWAVGVRTFNFDGHGKGSNRQRKGVDYNTKDQSVNQLWPGYVAGEWHNNHHLYPNSARSGFKPHQLDLAWCYIKMMSVFGAVSSYKDNKKQFYAEYYLPSLEEKKSVKNTPPSGSQSLL